MGQTAVQASSLTNVKTITIEADDGNANDIFVGDSTVTTDKYSAKLAAGERFEWNADDDAGALGIDPSTIYLISDAAAQAVQIGIVK